MSTKTVKDTRKKNSGASFFNAMSYMLETALNEQICTAEVVRVVSVAGGGSGGNTGYVDVLPMVCQTDAYNNIIAPTTLYHLPYARMQGGKAALIIDPKPGDLGIAVFTKRDSSGVIAGQQEPIKPASFRKFDQADGFYIGGFLNQAPTVFLELDQSGNATLTAGTKVTVNTAFCEINAAQTTAKGNLTVTGNLTVSGGITGGGGASMTGGLRNTGGQIVSNGITLETHRHGGIQSGGSKTEGPE